MAAITWNDSLSVGIKSIDDQHKVLVDMINEFYNNINSQVNIVIVSNLVSGMKEYTVKHFFTEERYMVKFKYPDYEKHKKEHDAFIVKVNELDDKLKKGTAIISFEITNFLKNWLIEHIQKTDKQFSAFFIQHGVD